MPSYNYLIPPVALATIGTPGELEAQVSTALPGTNIGFVWYSATAPDVITYPELKRFIWADLSGTRIVHRHWNNTTLSWETELPADGSITNSMLAGSITLNKISLTGATVGYVPRDVAGVLTWDDPTNLFTAGTFQVADTAIKLPASAGSWVLYSDGVTTGWSSFPTLFAAQTVAIAKISTTGATEKMALSYLGGALGYNAVESLLTDNSTPITKLAPGGALKSPRSNAANNGLEWVDSSVIVNAGKAGIGSTFTSSLVAIPAAGAAITPIAHTMAGVPFHYEWYLVCNDAAGDAGFAQNDEIKLSSTFGASGVADDRGPEFSEWADSTNLYLRRDSDGFTIIVFHKTTGASTDITDETKWRLKCRAMYFA